MKWYDKLPPEIFGESPKQANPIGYTGNGPMGVPRKNMPTNMVQTTSGPVMLHEGEGTIQNPNGSLTVVPKEKLKQMESNYRIPGFAIGGTTDPLITQTNQKDAIGTLGTTATTPQQDINAGLGVYRDIVAGKSPVTQNLYNQQMSQFGGAASASIGAAKQEAAQAGYGGQAIGAIGQTAARNIEGERSKLQSNLAVNSAAQMTAAAGNLINQGTAERTYQNNQKDTEWSRDLLNYDPANPEELGYLQNKYTELYGTPAPSLAVLTENRNNAKALAANQVKASDLNIQDIQNRMDEQTYSSLSNRIANGASFDEINRTNPGAMTLAEYNTIKRKGEISLATQEMGLTNLKTSTDSATWNAAVNRILQNPNITLADAQKIPGMENITQQDLNGILNQYLTDKNEKLWQDAVLYNDASTPEGKAELQRIYSETHPGQTADLNQIALLASKAKSDLISEAAGTATKTSENIVADLTEGGKPLDEASVLTSTAYTSAISNKTLRQAVATKLGLPDGDNITNKSVIDSEIKKMILNSSQGDVGVVLNNIQSYIPTKDLDNPALQGELKTAIQHLLISGGITRNDDGTFKINESVDLPWNAPETYFEYTDFNGNDIEYTNGVKPANYDNTVVKIDGVNAKKTVGGVTSDITFKDMDNKWSSLSPSDRQRYISDGKFDNKGFVQDYFGSGTGLNGSTITLNADDIAKRFLSPGNEDLDTIYANIAGTVDANGKVSNQFQSFGKYPGTVGQGSDPNAGKPIAETDFQYYDENGAWHTASKDSSTLSNIWYQMSQMFNNGKIMTTQQFNQVWNDGKGWAITSDGTVANFQPEYQKTNELDPNNPVFKNGTPVKFDFVAGSKKTFSDAQISDVMSRWDDLVAANDSRVASEYSTIGKNFDAGKAYMKKNAGKVMNYNGKLYEVTGGYSSSGSWFYLEVRDLSTGALENIDPNGGVIPHRTAALAQ